MPAQKPKWVQHFKIDDVTWERLCALASKNTFSPLDVALEMGIINQEKLLIWDRDTSKIPTLKVDFFNSQPPLELFQKFDYLKCREKACMPVTEWNGNIYWAKLSSDHTGFETPDSGDLWFLSSWVGLKKWFIAWKATLRAFDSFESKSFTGTEINVFPSHSTEEPAPALIKLEPLRPAISSKGKPFEAPVGLTDVSKKVTATIDFSSLMGAPTPPIPVPDSHAKPLSKIQTIALDQLETRIRLATTQDSLAETFMGAWQNYFEQIMILLYQNNQLVVWWHNFQFKNQVNRGGVISLDSPSVFKIVAETGHPYHGYVSQSPTNDHFFRISNGGQYPEHLTIIPVMSDERVVAMLLGTCSTEVGKTIVLPKLEEDSRLFSNYLTRLTSPIKRTG